MKKLYTLLFVFGISQTHAQVSNAWKTEIESVFQHVNRTPVTTGLLNGYGLYFTNIDSSTVSRATLIYTAQEGDIGVTPIDCKNSGS